MFPLIFQALRNVVDAVIKTIRQIECNDTLEASWIGKNQNVHILVRALDEMQYKSYKIRKRDMVTILVNFPFSVFIVYNALGMHFL